MQFFISIILTLIFFEHFLNIFYYVVIAYVKQVDFVIFTGFTSFCALPQVFAVFCHQNPFHEFYISTRAFIIY